MVIAQRTESEQTVSLPAETKKKGGNVLRRVSWIAFWSSLGGLVAPYIPNDITSIVSPSTVIITPELPPQYYIPLLTITFASVIGLIYTDLRNPGKYTTNFRAPRPTA